MVAAKPITVEELEAMGGGGKHTELVDGVLVEMSPSAWDHAAIASEVHGFLASYMRQHRSGQLFIADPGFVVAREPDSVLAPDIAYVSKERLPELKRGRVFAPLSPDLVVEVESPSNTERESARKVRLYLDGGTKLIWIFRPRLRVVTVYRDNGSVESLTESEELDGHDVIPGFKLKIAEIFQALE